MTRARVCLASCMRVTRLMHVRDVARLLPKTRLYESDVTHLHVLPMRRHLFTRVM